MRQLASASASTYVGYMCRLRLCEAHRAPANAFCRCSWPTSSARHYGYDLMKAAKLPSGTLYPMLARLAGPGPGHLRMGTPARRRQRAAAPEVLPAHRRRRPRRPARTRPGRPGLDGAPPRRHGAASPRERAVTRRPPAQRIAEHLIRRACRRLPGDTRDERYREWAAELPAILHDHDVQRPDPAHSPHAPATPSASSGAPATCAAADWHRPPGHPPARRSSPGPDGVFLAIAGRGRLVSPWLRSALPSRRRSRHPARGCRWFWRQSSSPAFSS